ncbi:MAG: transporter substrate-binding domain-containing protein [Pseudomonadota bacterium]|nr:transporter substrate-binding domain-containing protein [Pseudomonadota bacterium]
MQLNDEFERANLKTRQHLMVVVLAVTLVTALISVSLHYWFSRDMALEAAAERYQLTATATRDYLAHIDSKAMETVRVLSRFPQLVTESGDNGPWINRATPELFAEVMRSSPLFYALYIGFDDGDVYELVNLNSNEAVRRQLNATPSDRWVIIRVEGEGAQRQRTFDYYSATFERNFSRSEPSNYDARERLWYTTAEAGSVRKTPPYLFQHLQAPGQSFVTRLAGTDHVLALDITFSTLSSHLRAQSLSADGELFLFEQNGDLLASNLSSEDAGRLPPVPRLSLSAEQRAYLRSLGSVRVSNETDWTPVDFAVGGEPRGYSVDVMRLIAQMTGLSLEFVNGYRWSELVAMYERQDLELLQPVVPLNDSPGQLSRPLLSLPFGLVSRRDQPAVSDLSQLAGKRLVMPEGWSVLPLLQQQYPAIQIDTVADTRAALTAVEQGRADATLDTALVLKQSMTQFFLQNLVLHDNIKGLEALPRTVHIRTRPELEPLAAIIDEALQAIPAEAYAFLQDKWFSAPAQTAGGLPVVPYEHLMTLPRQPSSQDRVQTVRLNGRDYLSFASVFTRAMNPPEYFALVIPAEKVYARSVYQLWTSVIIIGLVWILLMPVVLIFMVLRPVEKLAARRP